MKSWKFCCVLIFLLVDNVRGESIKVAPNNHDGAVARDLDDRHLSPGCSDDGSFRFIRGNGKEAGCGFIAKKTKARCRKIIDGEKVKRRCPMTCDACLTEAACAAVCPADDNGFNIDKNKDDPNDCMKCTVQDIAGKWTYLSPCKGGSMFEVDISCDNSPTHWGAILCRYEERKIAKWTPDREIIDLKSGEEQQCTAAGSFYLESKNNCKSGLVFLNEGTCEGDTVYSLMFQLQNNVLSILFSKDNGKKFYNLKSPRRATKVEDNARKLKSKPKEPVQPLAEDCTDDGDNPDGSNELSSQEKIDMLYEDIRNFHRNFDELSVGDSIPQCPSLCSYQPKLKTEYIIMFYENECKDCGGGKWSQLTEMMKENIEKFQSLVILDVNIKKTIEMVRSMYQGIARICDSYDGDECFHKLWGKVLRYDSDGYKLSSEIKFDMMYEKVMNLNFLSTEIEKLIIPEESEFKGVVLLDAKAEKTIEMVEMFYKAFDWACRKNNEKKNDCLDYNFRRFLPYYGITW